MLPEEPIEPPTPPAIINFKTLNGEVKGYNVQESQYAGLSQEQIVSFVQQAKTDVAVYLEELGYVIDWDYVKMPTYSQLYGVKDANGDLYTKNMSNVTSSTSVTIYASDGTTVLYSK